MSEIGSHASFGINSNKGKYILTILINYIYICKQPYSFQLKGVTEAQPSVIELSDAGMSFSVTLPNRLQSLELD